MNQAARITGVQNRAESIDVDDGATARFHPICLDLDDLHSSIKVLRRNRK